MYYIRFLLLCLAFGAFLLPEQINYRHIQGFRVGIAQRHRTTDQHNSFVPQYEASAVAVRVAPIVLEYITVVNPIVATVGAAVALTVVGQQAYQAYVKQQTLNSDIPDNILLAERNYFELRKFNLENIKSELTAMKSGLMNLGLGGTSFTNTLLQQCTQRSLFNIFTVSASQELLLSEFEMHELRKQREFELAELEQEIIELQLFLALHVNELIVQVEAAQHEHEKTSDQIAQAIDSWNALSDSRALTKAKALEGYESDYLEKYLIEKFEDRVVELKRVVEYYSVCAVSFCLKKSTNIIEKLHDLKQLIKDQEKYIGEHQQRIKQNISISRQACASHGVHLDAISKKVKAFYEQKKKEVVEQALKDAEIKKQKLNSSGDGPQKDDEQDKKEQKNSAVHNMQDFFKNTPFGLLIEDCVEKTKKYVQGQPVYKVLQNFGKSLRKGDQIYLDNLHKDHLEVFAKDGSFKTVLDFEGNEIFSKVQRAKGRTI